MKRLYPVVHDQVKDDFVKLCDDLGLTISEAIEKLMINAIEKQGQPCDVALDDFYSPEHMAELQRRYEASKK